MFHDVHNHINKRLCYCRKDIHQQSHTVNVHHNIHLLTDGRAPHIVNELQSIIAKYNNTINILQKHQVTDRAAVDHICTTTRTLTSNHQHATHSPRTSSDGQQLLIDIYHEQHSGPHITSPCLFTTQAPTATPVHSRRMPH